MASPAGGGADWRTRGNRRPSSFGGASRGPDPLEPPTMSRSRVQIATSYAPGVLLTWEGGKGICRSVPLANDITKTLGPTTIDLIYENMRDFVSNWRDRVRKALPDAPDEFILDGPFRHSHSGQVSIERQTFQMTGPDNRWAFGGVRPNYPGCGDGRLPASAAHLRRSGPVERRAADRAQEQAERRQVPRRRGGPRCPPGSGGARTRYRGAGVRVRATSRAVPAAAGRARGRPP